VVDGGNEERLAARFRVERVVELEFRCVTGTEMVELLGGLGLRRVDLICRLERSVSNSFLYASASPALT